MTPNRGRFSSFWPLWSWLRLFSSSYWSPLLSLYWRDLCVSGVYHVSHGTLSFITCFSRGMQPTIALESSHLCSTMVYYHWRGDKVFSNSEKILQNRKINWSQVISHIGPQDITQIRNITLYNIITYSKLTKTLSERFFWCQIWNYMC